ncbi:YihY/virulence factor BrkB family protein [Agilicoccus flavus]|uniref:YihY/virulence factor BrkB family protein n=1 Tax=Agilicoccus flavus TaxID=2775968 RepID=UPI001CF68399|nr:YihY/virulence factor BrkB family protein [Agilicoccus flavus]
MSDDAGSAATRENAPNPDHPDKPDSLTDISKPSWTFTAKKAFMEFTRDQCTDLAASLTYYAVLALFPALLALVSLLGVFGQGQESVNRILETTNGVVPASAQEQIRPVIAQMVNSGGAGLALVLGILGALWSASGYVNAFSRAMNRIYEIDEGRPIWKLRPLMLVLTLVILVLVALVLVGLVVSGPVAQFVGDLVGLGSTAVTVWDLAKWPVILVVVIFIVALLYYVTPNVKQPKFRWVSVGAAVAILTWVLASAAFGFYVGNFGSYNKTYGALAGVIVFLLWLWITNNALLLGAEIDSELERARQLQAGIKAEEHLQLPPRDTKMSEKAESKRDAMIEEGRQIRLENEAGAGTD